MAAWPVLVAFVLAAPVKPASQPQKLFVEATEAPVAPAQSNAPDFTALAKFARPSVVSITAIGTDDALEVEGAPSAREFFERFYGAADPPTKGMAAGFIVRDDGYILTNAHVVEEAAGIAVALGDEEGRSYPATVVGRDELSDLALLKINVDRPLTALPLGDSDALQVGDWVAAIGNPFGLSRSLTVGVVSYIGRRDIHPSGRPGYYDFIQTDASINPGNSGGPLLDRSGRVIGISAAVNASGQGIGFAIPVNMAKDVMPSLYGAGSVRRSYLGVSIQDLTPELAESFGVDKGVVVTEVASDGPAAKAGLAVGDVITEFAGTPIEQAYRLRWLASSAGVGQNVKLSYRRAGSVKEVSLVLVPLPGSQKTFHRTEAPAPRSDLAPLGFTLGGPANSPNGRGLRVTAIDPVSPAYVAGLREGDVVLAAQDGPVKSQREIAAQAKKGGVLRLFIQRGIRPMFVAFRMH